MIIKELQTHTILTPSNLPVSDYSVNPYVGCPHQCRYCYASFMKRFTQHPEPWGEFLDVKYWPPIRNPQKYRGKEIFLGSVTDPYHPEEKHYQRTRTFLKEMQGSGIQLSIQTKSDLVLRDLDLIQTFPNARVGFSINTLDATFQKEMDCAVSIERRIHAMQTLYQAGIRTTGFISPIFPGITDVFAIIERVQNHCNLVWLENLNLRGSYKANILNYIKTKYPELAPLYHQIYTEGQRDYWENLNREVTDYAQHHKLNYIRDNATLGSPMGAPPVIVNFFFHEEIKKSAKKKKPTPNDTPDFFENL